MGPGRGRGRFFGPGEVRLALLSLLSESPRHGYELMRELEGRCAGAYTASAGGVYPTLQQLEDEGLIRSASIDGKKVCTVTAAGRRELGHQTERVAEIWRRAKERGEWSSFDAPELVEILRPVKKLVKAAHRTLAKDPELADAVREILETARRDVETLSRNRSG